MVEKKEDTTDIPYSLLSSSRRIMTSCKVGGVLMIAVPQEQEVKSVNKRTMCQCVIYILVTFWEFD